MEEIKDLNHLNMASYVVKIFKECLVETYKENDTSIKIVEGVFAKYPLNKDKLIANKQNIIKLINELAKEFCETLSFLNICFNKNQQIWGDQIDGEKLLVLGIGLDLINYFQPKVYWKFFPGCVPFIKIKNHDSREELIK